VFVEESEDGFDGVSEFLVDFVVEDGVVVEGSMEEVLGEEMEGGGSLLGDAVGPAFGGEQTLQPDEFALHGLGLLAHRDWIIIEKISKRVNSLYSLALAPKGFRISLAKPRKGGYFLKNGKMIKIV
jgi:hypothetical protein